MSGHGSEPSGASRDPQVARGDSGGGRTGRVASCPDRCAGVLVRATSRGPAIFRQERVGRGGRPFTLFKLRTMRVSDERAPGDGPGRRADHAGRKVSAPFEARRAAAALERRQGRHVARGTAPRGAALRAIWRIRVWQRVLRVRPGITDPVTLQLRDEEALLAGGRRGPRAVLPGRASAREAAAVRGLPRRAVRPGPMSRSCTRRFWQSSSRDGRSGPGPRPGDASKSPAKQCLRSSKCCKKWAFSLICVKIEACPRPLGRGGKRVARSRGIVSSPFEKETATGLFAGREEVTEDGARRQPWRGVYLSSGETIEDG